MEIANVTRAFAMIHSYGRPDNDWLTASSNTVWSCQRTDTLLAIDVKTILSVVAMVPHTQQDGQLGPYHGRVFVVEKMGLDVMPLTGALEDPVDNEIEYVAT